MVLFFQSIRNVWNMQPSLQSVAFAFRHTIPTGLPGLACNSHKKVSVFPILGSSSKKTLAESFGSRRTCFYLQPQNLGGGVSLNKQYHWACAKGYLIWRADRRRRISIYPLQTAMSTSSMGDIEIDAFRLAVYGRTKEDISEFTATLKEKDMTYLEPATSMESKMESGPNRFNKELFFSMLRSFRVGNVVLYADTLQSTQTVLFKQLDIERDGVLCLTDKQKSGRGRGGNQWSSPDGALTFSMTASIDQPYLLPFFQYLVSMAVYEAVSSIAGADAKEAIGLQVRPLHPHMHALSSISA